MEEQINLDGGGNVQTYWASNIIIFWSNFFVNVYVFHISFMFRLGKK